MQVETMTELSATPGAADPMRGLAGFTRSIAPSNGMDAQRATGVLLSSAAAAQRCVKGAGLDSGAAVVAQFAMPSIALPCSARPQATFHRRPPHPWRLSLSLESLGQCNPRDLFTGPD